MLAKRETIKDKQNDIDQQIKAISAQHGITDPRKQAGQYNTINSGIGTLRTDLDRENRKLDTSKKTIENLKGQIDSINSNLTQIGAAYTGAIVTTVPETEWKYISKELADICTKVRDKAHIDLLQKIVVRANQYYKLFTKHDRGYTGIIEIDNEFNIRFDPALNRSHEDRKKMSVINALLTLNQEALGISYPFVSDAPTSDFDIPAAHHYYMGIKDIFGQTIIMTKDVEIGSPNYNQLFSNTKVSHIYQLNSKLYCGAGHEPEQFEVSTKVEQLK